MIYPKEFYFIRHGQTDYNISGEKLDHEDVSLNMTGRNQAYAVEPLIASLPIKSICCSPLKRAKETKEIISSKLQATHYEIPELGECSVQIWNDMNACRPNALKSSLKHVNTFIEQTLIGINQALSVEGPVLVVAHGGIHWAICCLMEIENHTWLIDNCLPLHFSIDTEGHWGARKLVV